MTDSYVYSSSSSVLKSSANFYGELKTRSAMMLPVGAALGGMIVPAILYALINFGTPTAGGWGIPMATDIALRSAS